MKNTRQSVRNAVIRAAGRAVPGILLAALVSCTNFLDLPNAGSGGGTSLDVTIYPGEGRTLLPRFSDYSVSFSAEGKKTVVLDNLAAPSAKAYLEPGTWTVTARAVVRINGTAYTAAEGSEQVRLEAGQNKNVGIRLRMPQGNGRGTLYYKIGLPGDMTLGAATLSLAPLEEGSSRAFDLLERDENSVADINSGIYLMTITLKAGNLSAAKTEVVHIYPRMETRVEGDAYRFLKENFKTGVYLAGTASMGNTQDYSMNRLEIYGDANRFQLLATVNKFTGSNNSWTALLDADIYGGTVYIRPVLGKEGSIIYAKTGQFSPGPEGSDSINLPSSSVYTITTRVEGPGFGTFNVVPADGNPAAGPAADVIGGVPVEIEARVSRVGKYRVRKGYPRLEAESGAEISLSAGESGHFRFTMPESNVAAAVRFETIVDLGGVTLKSGSGGSVVYTPLPAFNPDITEYQAGVPNGIGLISSVNGPANNRAQITGTALLPGLTTVSYLFDGASWPGGDKNTSAAGNTVTIRVSANTADDDAFRDYKITVKKSSASGLPVINSFGFTKEANAGSLSAYAAGITGTVNRADRTITITHNGNSVYRWINGLTLKASFTTTPGAKVYVGGVEQISGVSALDFGGETVYTVISGDGLLRNDYTVIFHSPQLTGLPSVRVKTQDGKTINSRTVYQKARIQTSDPVNPAYNIDFPSDASSYPDGIRGCGNTAWTNVSGDNDYGRKNPYLIKFGSTKSLFGLTSAKTWVLLANKTDPTLILNTVALEAARTIGLEFVNHTIPVELYVNERYMGSYVLTEQVQVNPGRVNIDSKKGFFISMDTYNYYPPEYTGAGPRFKAGVKLQLPLMFKSPETDGLTAPLDLDRNSSAAPHTTYRPFMAVMDKFVDALESTDSAVFPAQYRTCIDMNNFIDLIMMNEMVRNTEVLYPKNFYFYRDAGDDAKIRMGPPWDFDRAFGGDDSGN
ncbi:MAG: CotH kinase family protein [Treponema sp.]|jgi:hypothetical protein|nr:CotH kinase family protein [Treponema sp.]